MNEMRCPIPPSGASGRALIGLVIGELVLAATLIIVAVWLATSFTTETTPERNQVPLVDRTMEIDAVTGPQVMADPNLARPIRWLPSEGDECRERQGRQVCDGPRKVPRPHGDAAALARALGLGPRKAARQQLSQGPTLEWTLAVRGQYDDAFAWPVEGGRLWRGFGQGWPGGEGTDHDGVDIGAPAGTPIFAVADGIVAYADNEISGYGNVVLVIHVDGAVTLYAHCRAAWVFAGQQVRRGQPIAEVGETGITHGAHLHFELRQRGQPQDPMPFLRRGRGDS